MLGALRIRDFRLLWGARLVSQLGSWLLVIAIPAHVFTLTGSVSATGLTVAADFLPVVDGRRGRVPGGRHRGDVRGTYPGHGVDRVFRAFRGKHGICCVPPGRPGADTAR